MAPIRFGLNFISNPEKPGVDPVAREETLLAIEKARVAASLTRYARTHDDAVTEEMIKPVQPTAQPIVPEAPTNVIPIKPEANPLFTADSARQAVEDVWAA